MTTANATPELLARIEASLEFTWCMGDTTPVAKPHDTGWRTLPYLVTAACEAEGTLEIAGRETLRGGPGLSAICVAPGVHHRCAVVGRPGTSRWSCCTFTILEGIDLFSLLEPPLQITGAPARRIGEINAELAELGRQPQPTLLAIARRRELGFALLGIVIERAAWRPDRDQLVRNSHRLMPVFAHIRENLGRRIRVEDLARRARLSPPRFHAVFLRAAGTSPHRYVQRLRLKKAQELLIGTDLPIAGIAARVGHDDPFLFSRIFAKRCGMSPSAYRTRVVGRMV